MTKRIKTDLTGVYIRESEKRVCADGSPDICYEFTWWSGKEKKTKWEKVGWKSEGYTISDAKKFRDEKIERDRIREVDYGVVPDTGQRNANISQDSGEDTAKKSGKQHSPRIKTNLTGVYYRFAEKRVCPDGTLDICYEIMWWSRREAKCKWAKVGWRSEGYTLDDAVKLRGEKVRADRTPELLSPADKQNRQQSGIGRHKCKQTGIYYREHETRLCADGKPDRCYEITWWSKKERKTKWEKIGWRSEGYDLEYAEKLRGEHIRKDRHPELPPARDCTLSEVWERYEKLWLPTLADGGEEFASRYHGYIEPAFKDHLLSEITNIDIEKFKKDIAHSGRRKPNLTPATVKKILNSFQTILRKAVEWGLYSGKLPNFVMPKTDSLRVRFFSPEEARKFLDVLQYINCDYYFVAKIAFHTGMRLNEIVLLRKQDINTDNRIIMIHNRRGKRKPFQKFAMYPAELDDDIAILLKRNRVSYIFISSKGTPYSKNTFSGKYSKIINEMGFNDGLDKDDTKFRLVFHSTRHTFCSWLVSEGVALKTVQELAGHTSISTTERYAKLAPGVMQAAISEISRKMNDKSEKLADLEEKP